MNKPVKGLLGKLRRAQPVAEPEPELTPDRLAALRVRAAVAEDPCLADNDTADEGLQPVLLPRATRDAEALWSAASSWFGGFPKLGAIDWPVGEDGYPLPFAAQIGLADLAAICPCCPLPATGSLAFFLGEGAVIHVPEGVSQFSPAPEGLLPFHAWPVAPVMLALPDDAQDHADPARHPAIREAMQAALPEGLHVGRAPFVAAESEADVPLWWHSVDHLIAWLHIALGDGAQGGKRDGLSALAGALEGFAADRNPWDRLNAEEQEVFAEALDNAWQQFGGQLDEHAPRSVADLSAYSILTMMTGEAHAFAALPAELRERINRDYRLPAGGLPQMFGLGLNVPDVLPDHLGDMLLLQLPHDDMIDMGMGEQGVCQFWIAPEALAERRWDQAVLSFGRA